MQIPGKLIAADLSDVEALQNRENLWLGRSVRAAEFVAATVGIWGAAKGYLGRTPSVSIDAGIAVAIAATLACGTYFERRRQRLELFRRNESQPDEISFTDEGIRYDWRNQASRQFSWKMCQSWQAGRRVLFVKSRSAYPYRSESLILPGASLSEIQRNAVQLLLRPKVPKLGDPPELESNSKNSPPILKLQAQLKFLTWVLLAAFGLSTLFGGALIHFLHPQTGRVHAEIYGQLIAVLFIALSLALAVYADDLSMGKVDPEGPKSLSEALRK